MPTIRISDETWDRLKQWAIPLEDSPNDAILKALDAAEGVEKSASTATSDPKQPRRRRGNKLPQKEFRSPLIMAVHELGGSASKKIICDWVYERVKHRLSEADHEPVKTGEPRWLNAVCWERKDLVNEGIFRSNSLRGVWELSDEGTKIAEAN